MEGNIILPDINLPQYYLIYANIDIYQKALDVVKAHMNKEKNDKMFHIIIVPKVLIQFEQLLESTGLYEKVKLHYFQWFPLYMDKSLLTLEIPNLYRSLYIFNDLSFLSIYAKSMWQLFLVTGKPTFTISIGLHSQRVMEQFHKMQKLKTAEDVQPNMISGMLVMDRSADYVSTLLTPATYTALLNEVCDINCGTYSTKQDEENQTCKKEFNIIPKINTNTFLLDSKCDNIYREIKHHNFALVTEVLSKLTKKLTLKGESITKEWNIQDGKNFISKELKDMVSTKQKVNNHLQASETIVNILGTRFEKQKEIEENILFNSGRSSNYKYLEEIVTTENNKRISLRLMCLLAITQKLTDSEVQNFCNKFFLEYGFNHGYLYNNLRRANFVEKSTKDFLMANRFLNISKLTISNSNFYNNIVKFKQIPKDPSKIDLKAPTCCSYVFGGLYIPLIASIASMLLHATPLKDLQTKLENIPNVSIENDNGNGYPLQSRSLIVYVIGGITYSEVAACSLLEKLTDSHIILVSDKVLSGNSLMDALLQQL